MKHYSNRRMFTKALLAGTALYAVAMLPANAQDAPAASAPQAPDASPTEVIIVGVRGSLQKSQDIKRKGEGIVDVITATDVGKFPDHNIADSLGRVPGVSVSREGGEGKTVSVRGFPSQYNAVTLNGRIISSDSQGRGFNFDVLASELISSAEVYKTSNASLSEGGIGGLINITTARPLNGKSGFHFAGQVSGNYDSQMGKTSPRYSGTGTWTNKDKTFGATVSLVYDERTNRNDIFDSGAGWFDGWGGEVSTGPTTAGPKVPYIHYLETSNFKVEQGKRKRQGLFTTLQYRPSEHLTVTFDALAARFDANLVTDERWNYNNGPGVIYNAVYDDNHTALSYDVAPEAGGYLEYIANNNPRTSSTDHFGLNFNYELSASGTLTVDMSQSKSSDLSAGKRTFISIGQLAYEPVHFDNNNGGIASYTNLPDPLHPTEYAVNQTVSADGGQPGGRNVHDDIRTYRIAYDQKFDGFFKDLYVGIDGSTRTKSHDARQTPGGIGNYYNGEWLQVPDSFVGVKYFDNFLDGVPGAGFPEVFGSVDGTALLDYLASPAAYNQDNPNFTPEENAARRADFLASLTAAGGSFASVPDLLNSGAVREETFSAFIQSTIGGEFYSMPWSSTFGVRYTQTDVLASGWDAELIGLTPLDPDNPRAGYEQIYKKDSAGNDAILPKSIRNAYHDLLPSASFKMDITDTLKFRAAASKTLTRPDLEDLTVTSSLITNDKPTRLGGDPKLRPYKSENLDAALEWYINKTDMVSFTVFHKTATDFPNEVLSTIDIFGVRFEDHQQTNALKTKLDGFELAAQYSFDEILPAPFDGLGIIASYTKINQDKKSEFQIPNIGDSYNLIGYYEKGSFQARLAYSWSGRSVACLGCDNYDSNGPWTFTGNRYNMPYDQLDFSSSYKINSNYEVFLEGTNLTNSHSMQYAGYKNRVTSAYYAGKRATFGVRAKF